MDNNAFKIVLEELKKINLFVGIYDAKNGNENFMYGISCVMECIANKAGDEEFSDLFLNNMCESERKKK